MVDRFQNWFTYRAYFSERLPAFPEHGHVLMRSPGGVATGIELRVGPGRIVFIPALEDVPAGEYRFELATAFVEAVKRAASGETEADAPRWVRRYTLPGLDDLEAAEAAAAQALQEAETQLAKARADAAGMAGLRNLLWAEGRYHFEPAVREAFRILGFAVDPDVDRPATIYADGRTFFFEVEGSRETVKEEVYIRLQRRVEKSMFETGETPKGIVVVNGQRRSSPGRRTEPASRPLRIAAENYRFALIHAPTLFDMVRAALSDGDATKSRLRDAIFDAAGEFTPNESLVPPAEQPAEPDAVETDA
jgi:hypothetical protein